MLTAERFRELLSYDVDTGIFTWIGRSSKYANPSRLGKRAGSVDAYGYRRVRIDGRIYLEHRIVWMLSHGCWPKGEIDHINGDKQDNRLANIRDVTRSVNQQNIRVARSTNRCGLLGVSAHLSRWRAQINDHGKMKCLGVFATPEQAHDAYVKAKREAHEGCTL